MLEVKLGAIAGHYLACHNSKGCSCHYPPSQSFSTISTFCCSLRNRMKEMINDK